MKKNSSLNNIRKNELQMGYGFMLPAVVFLVFFIFLSILYSFYMSFYEWKLFDLGAVRTFVGIDNYLNIFSDSVFGKALLNTLLLMFICLIAELVIGFLIALTLWTLKNCSRVIQSIILLPMITSPVVVGLLWRYIYDPQFGILNYFLRITLGVGNLAWLGDESLSLISVMIVDIWQMTPFVVLVLYTAMMGVSDDWIEAAQVDGARYWDIVLQLILPAIAPFISFAMLIRTMDLFKIFDTIYVMTKGGPGYSTETIALYTYKTGFSYYNMGYAMALSMITLLCVIILSSLYIRRSRQKA